MMKKVNKT